MSRFNYTGECKLNSPVVRDGMTKGKKPSKYKSISFSVAESINNRAYVECFGMVYDNVDTYDSDKNKISISWTDRNDDEVISKVAAWKKHIYRNGDVRKEFITEYDFISYLEEHADEINGKKVTVTGTTTKNIYNGSISDRFTIQNLYVEDEDKKNKLQISEEFYYDITGIDFSEWKSDHKLYINGYTSDYISGKELGTDKGANKYVAQQIVFDCSKLDFSNEKHTNLMNFKLKQLGLKDNDGSIGSKLKKKLVYKMAVVLGYTNGNTEVEFDESTLTPNQKEAIELGLNTIDDFKPKGQIYGDRVVEYRLKNFDLTGDYEDGVIAADMTTDELEEDVFTPSKPETLDEAIEEAETKTTATSSNDDSDLEDLF